MSFRELPPDPAPTIITFEMPASLAPYMRYLYSLEGLQGETIEQFLLRILIKRGKEYLVENSAKLIAEAMEIQKKLAISEAQETINALK